MGQTRFGVIGLGMMGLKHAQAVDLLENAKLTAVCDLDKALSERIGETYSVAWFSQADDLFQDNNVDAVIIATPHFSHTALSIKALQSGMHVLVEKPISVHKEDCEKLIAAHDDTSIVFAAMFNQRTNPVYIKVKQLIESGEIGSLVRMNWIITDWFRTEAYYANGSWRATWKGEGGGVLMNQCPHQLDLIQWLCGMPQKVRAFCSIGKFHRIEVEDEVTAYLEFPNGATGVFVCSTGEAPGTNRLEIIGERGKVVVEKDILHFTRNETETSEFRNNSTSFFEKPNVREIDFPISDSGGQHRGIIENFIQAINGEAELIAPGQEGIHSVELANSMLYSSVRNQTVDLPLDSRAYSSLLRELITESEGNKITRSKQPRRSRGSKCI